MRYLLPLFVSVALAACAAAPEASPLQQQYTWQEDGKTVEMTTVPDLVMEFGSATLKSEGARLERQQGDAYLWRIEPAELNSLLKSSEATLSPVLRDKTGAVRALPGGVVVQLDPSWTTAQTAAWLRRQGLEMRMRLPGSGNTVVVDTPAGLVALDTAQRLARMSEVVAATPNWWQERVPRPR